MFGFYTRFFACQVENTLSFTLILRIDFVKTVEKFCPCLWITLWKTSQVFLGQNLKIQVILTGRNTTCAKLSKLFVKKNFQSQKKLVLGQFFDSFLTKIYSKCEFLPKLSLVFVENIELLMNFLCRKFEMIGSASSFSFYSKLVSKTASSYLRPRKK
jgi:hypothetical protein